MLITSHLIVGAAIGRAVGNPFLAAPISFVVHYFMDAVPHYSFKPVKGFKELGVRGCDKVDALCKGIEPILGIAATLYLIFHTSGGSSAAMITGAFFGWLPDLFTLLDWKYGFLSNRFIRTIDKKFHRHVAFPRGILSQIAVTALAFIFIFRS